MNAAQFESFVNQYEKLVYTVCWQLVRDRELAQDLSQETFLSAWRSIERCPEGHEAQWLARIAANKAKDHLRSAWNRRVSLSADGSTPGQDVPDTAPGPEALLANRDGAKEVEQLILALREPYKTPCRLMLLEQHTAAEAARLCGRPQKTVEAQIYRAKKMLAEKIRQERRSEDGIVS